MWHYSPNALWSTSIFCCLPTIYGMDKQCVEEAHNNDLYHPGKLPMTENIRIVTSCPLVLIAHNGFAFDFLFLMAEIKRRNLEESFNTTNLWFSDTLYDVKRVS